MMQKSGSFQEHVKHPDLYNALIGLIGLDDAIAKGDIDPTKVLKRDVMMTKIKIPRLILKRGRRKEDEMILSHERIQEAAMESEEPIQDNDVNAEEQSKDDAAPKQDNFIWFKQDFNELVNAEKDPVTFDDLIGSTIDFTKLAKNRQKKDKITKANLEGTAFKLLKGTCRNIIKLEYNLEQYLTLSDQLDWANLEGNKERKYAASLTKTKAARYKLKGIKDMIPKLRSSTKDAYDKNATFRIHHWGPKHQLFYKSRNAATS
ncbi:hypothetical protein Tco_0472544 [Tanacetum coccineum]